MGKKMKLIPSMFKNPSSSQQCHWPLCKQPKTLSFRAGDDMFKTVNSIFFDPCDEIETPKTWFTISSESTSISTEPEEYFLEEESLESIIKGVQSSKRLFFQPQDTNSLIREAKVDKEYFPFKESVALAMESENPYQDFKSSMEEMIEINGLKDCECLEELLGWYLKMNEKRHHGFIIEAFIDMLTRFASFSSESNSSVSVESSLSSPASPLSNASQ